MDWADIAWYLVAGVAGLAMLVILVELWLRSRPCAHEFRIDRIRRMPDGNVRARCTKCRVVAFAPYGLALPGKLVR